MAIYIMPSFNWNGYYSFKMFNSNVAKRKKKSKVCHTVARPGVIKATRRESILGRVGYQTGALPIAL